MKAESWSFLLEGDQSGRPFDGGRADFCDGNFRGSMERIEFRPGFRLYRVEGCSTRPYTLTPEGVTPRGTMLLGAMLGGSGRVTMEGVEDRDWRDERNFYSLTPERQVTYHIRPGKRWRALALLLAPQALADLASGDDLPELARDTMEGRARPFAIMRPLGGAATARLAADLFDSPYSGRMAMLHRQAKSMEFLAGLMEMLGCATRPAALSPRDRARVGAARERLLADLRSPPDLHTLAYSVGLGPKRLNEGFRAMFGATVFDYLRDARLDAARKLLEEDGNAPLKQIAWRVGYSHATNFISAYHRRFGAPPARHRRGRLPAG